VKKPSFSPLFFSFFLFFFSNKRTERLPGGFALPFVFFLLLNTPYSFTTSPFPQTHGIATRILSRVSHNKLAIKIHRDLRINSKTHRKATIEN